MTSKKVQDAWDNYGVPDDGFVKRDNAAKEKYRELLEQFTSGEHRPVMDAMQLIISKATFYDWLVIKLDSMLKEREITVVLSTNGQYVVSNEHEPLRWFDNPATAYMFALEKLLEDISREQ